MDKNYINEVLEEWNNVFMGDVPKMIKSCEVKNVDGSYSCITCGIKRNKIGEWWKQKLNQVEQRKVEEIREMVVNYDEVYINEDVGKAIDRMKDSITDSLKTKE